MYITFCIFTPINVYIYANNIYKYIYVYIYIIRWYLFQLIVTLFTRYFSSILIKNVFPYLYEINNLSI